MSSFQSLLSIFVLSLFLQLAPAAVIRSKRQLYVPTPKDYEKFTEKYEYIGNPYTREDLLVRKKPRYEYSSLGSPLGLDKTYQYDRAFPALQISYQDVRTSAQNAFNGVYGWPNPYRPEGFSGVAGLAQANDPSNFGGGIVLGNMLSFERIWPSLYPNVDNSGIKLNRQSLGQWLNIG